MSLPVPRSGVLPAAAGVTAALAFWAVVLTAGSAAAQTVVPGVGEVGPTVGQVETPRLLQEEGRGMEIAGAAGRAMMYIGALLAVGGAAFLVFAYDRRPRDARLLIKVVVAAAILGAAGSLVGMPIQAAHVSGEGVMAMADTEVTNQVLESNFGAATIVRLAGLALLLVGVARLWARWAILASLTGALVTLGSFLMAGHTVTTEPRWLVVTATFAHTLTGALWFGGLVLLAVALRRRRLEMDANGGARMVARFSMMALVSVLVLLVAGTALAWAEVRSLEALLATGYGWTLLIKVTVVLAVVAIGAYNNQRLVPAVQKGAGHAWSLLSRTVRIEAVGIVVVLGVTAVLVNEVPARNYVPTEPVAAFADLGSEHQVQLVVEPEGADVHQFHLYLLDDRGTVADIADEVRLVMELPDAHVTSIEREPHAAGPGHFFYAGPELSTAGDWTVEVRVAEDGREPLSAQFRVAVGRAVEDVRPLAAHREEGHGEGGRG